MILGSANFPIDLSKFPFSSLPIAAVDSRCHMHIPQEIVNTSHLFLSQPSKDTIPPAQSIGSAIQMKSKKENLPPSGISRISWE